MAGAPDERSLKTLATSVTSSVIALELAASGRERTKTADNRFEPEVPVME
jgi:hypothetical protein